MASLKKDTKKTKKKETLNLDTHKSEAERIIAEHMVPFLAHWKGYQPHGLTTRWGGNTKFENDLMKALIGINVGTPQTVKSHLEDMMNNARERSEMPPRPMVSLCLTVNPYTTRFQHEYRQALSLSLSVMKEKQTSPIEFLNSLVHNVNGKDGDRHLYIIDAVLLFGANYDALLTLVTDNGVTGVMEYETKYLSEYPWVTRISTWPVVYNYSRQDDGR